MEPFKRWSYCPDLVLPAHRVRSERWVPPGGGTRRGPEGRESRRPLRGAERGRGNPDDHFLARRPRALTVPFTTFESPESGEAPDFRDVSVTDYGQTVRLGRFEASVESPLYEHDPEYRRRVARKRRREDRSFGASFRRLRKQRGLRREDFEPEVTAKTVARIEQGRVSRIRKRTLHALAGRLSVDPEEIPTF